MEETSWQAILGWSTLVAIASFIGTAAAEIAKTYFSSVGFAKWQAKQDARKLYERYRDPLALAASELASRMVEINKEFPPKFLNRKVLSVRTNRLSRNSSSDEYYLKYKLISTMYRFCSMLGWLETYRRDTVFLVSGQSEKDRRISNCIAKLRSILGDGHLNNFSDFHNWKDHIIFREELRAVGEIMTRSAASNYQVMGYADFEQVLVGDENNGRRWLGSTIEFFADPIQQKDFREIRFNLVLLELCDLVRCLTDKPPSNWQLAGEQRARERIAALNYKWPIS